jgi:hypothetical protein
MFWKLAQDPSMVQIQTCPEAGKGVEGSRPNTRTDPTSPQTAFLTNHGRQHCRVGGLSTEHEQGQAPAEGHFWPEYGSVEHLKYRRGALD